jgi:large subunit ribosomal protein L19
MQIIQDQLKTDLPEIRPGQTVRVSQKVKEGNKERIQQFEGLVIAQKHGRGINGTFTVRKVSDRIGVERTYPLHSPAIQKIQIMKTSKVRRSKLYYMRERFGKKARMKNRANIAVPEEKKAKEE